MIDCTIKRAVRDGCAIVAAAVLALAGFALPAAARDNVFTVAKYPVDATGANAIAAKREALAEGRRAAFRSLLKRLLPAQQYPRIDDVLSQADPGRLIAGTRVVSEENSATQYIATLDFSFDPDGVRGLLQRNGITFVDQPAPTTLLLPVFTSPAATGAPAALAGERGARLWRSVWAGLDLANALAPLDLAPDSGLAADKLAALRSADPTVLAEVAGAARAAQFIIAEARPDPASGVLHVTLAGQDVAGRFALDTRFEFDKEDPRYSLELAAVVAQGILEGRWKASLLGDTVAMPAVAGGPPTPLQLVAEFSTLAQWHRQQEVLASTPGVTDLQIGGVSGRSASIALVFPGGGPALQSALAGRGLTLENINGFWVMR
jgi:hypothetical protein